MLAVVLLDIGHIDLCACIGQLAGDHFANAAPRTEDYGSLVAQIDGHFHVFPSNDVFS